MLEKTDDLFEDRVVLRSRGELHNDAGGTHNEANGGTDFAPIIEGILRNRQDGGDMPEFVTVPHEHVAVGMAQG